VCGRSEQFPAQPGPANDASRADCRKYGLCRGRAGVGGTEVPSGFGNRLARAWQTSRRRRPERSTTTAAEAFALKRGVPGPDPDSSSRTRAREGGFPARYVGIFPSQRRGDPAAGPATPGREALISELRLGGRFDPAKGICATDAHVRVAVGHRLYGRAPVRRHPAPAGASRLWRERG